MGIRRHNFAWPEGYDSWWSIDIDVPEHSIDTFGHVTASHYPALTEEAVYSCQAQMFGTDDFLFVTAQLHLFYRREVRLEHAPLRVHVAVAAATDSSMDMHAVVVDSGGGAKALAEGHYVAWDHEKRRRRTITADERRAIEQLSRPTRSPA